jgi:hypothetical protein
MNEKKSMIQKNLHNTVQSFCRVTSELIALYIERVVCCRKKSELAFALYRKGSRPPNLLHHFQPEINVFRYSTYSSDFFNKMVSFIL